MHTQTEKKRTNVANLQRGCKITTQQTQTQREVSSKTRKRVRVRTDSVSNHYGDKEGASGRHVWDTVRHYNNMTQAEPNDALQAITAQIPDRGWRLAARKRSGADGEIGKNSDTSNLMTGSEHHQSGSNKSASRRAATSRHTPRTLGNLQEMLNAGMRHTGSNIGGANSK